MPLIVIVLGVKILMLYLFQNKVPKTASRTLGPPSAGGSAVIDRNLAIEGH